MPSFDDIRTDCPRCDRVAGNQQHHKTWSNDHPFQVLIHQFVCIHPFDADEPSEGCGLMFRVAVALE